ncbi:hypothetical protein ACQZV8_10705 [Magnetococcales bacterium HHB-1]
MCDPTYATTLVGGLSLAQQLDQQRKQKEQQEAENRIMQMRLDQAQKRNQQNHQQLLKQVNDFAKRNKIETSSFKPVDDPNNLLKSALTKGSSFDRYQQRLDKTLRDEMNRVGAIMVRMSKIDHL